MVVHRPMNMITKEFLVLIVYMQTQINRDFYDMVQGRFLTRFLLAILRKHQPVLAPLRIKEK